MKKFTLMAVLAIAALPGISQTFEMGLHYSGDIPYKSSMPNMSMNNGAGINLGYRIMKAAPLWLNADFSGGLYASKTREETYVFSDGSDTRTDVQYTSSMYKFLAGPSFDIGSRDELLWGYATVQGGLAGMSSRVYVEDPKDPDGCTALEKKNTFSDRTGVVALGAGLRMNVGKRSGHFRQYIELGARYMMGGRIDYVNINYMKEEPHNMANGMNTSTDGRDLNIKFVNVSTNSIHEHKVAEIYSSTFKMLNVRFAYVLTF